MPAFATSLGILDSLRSSRRVTSLPVTEHKAVVATRAFLADDSAVLSNGNHYVARTGAPGGPTATRAAKLRADVVALGRSAILNPDWPLRAAQPDFVPTRPPMSVADLVARGASPGFANYLRNFKGLVAD